MFIQVTRTSILLAIIIIIFFLPLVILLTGCGSNIVEGTVMSSNFKWISLNETDLYTCKKTGLNGQHWCENAYPGKCNFLFPLILVFTK